MLNAVLALNELDTTVFDSPSLGASPRVDSGYVTVPDAHLLFTGEFKRVGTNDLKIVGEDGESFFIPDYFAAEKRAHLMSPEGATLSPQVVEALAGPLAPGQHAQAGTPAVSGQPVIGRVDAVTGSATVVRNGVSVALNVGDNVRQGDVVQTSGSSSVAIVLADGSTFSLNANARMVLDSLVYNAGGTGNSALVSLVQGTFSFVAGQVAKTGEMRVETPVATMGIRGTAVLVEISSTDGQTKFSVMVEPDGTTGAFNLYNKTTGALIGTVNNSQVGWVLTPSGPLQVLAQQVAKTPGELQQELGIVQQIFTIFNNNQQNPFVPPQQDSPERRGDNPDKANPQSAQGAGGSGQTLTVTVPVTTPENPVPTNVNVTITPVTPTPTTPTTPTTPVGTTPPPPVSPPIVTPTINIINGEGPIDGTPGIDQITGSDNNDTIDAKAGNDFVFAGGGNDVIFGGHGEGDDFYDGGPGHDKITFTSAAEQNQPGVTFNLNSGTFSLVGVGVVKSSTAESVTTGLDLFVRVEEIVASSGNDIFILHDTGDWTIDAGAGTDIVRFANGIDIVDLEGGPEISNFEILDLQTDTAENIVYFDVADFDSIGNSVPLRILGGTNDVINITNHFGIGAPLIALGTFTDPSSDAHEGDPFNDHYSDGVTFDVYAVTIDGQTFNVYLQHGVQVAVPGAVNDQAAMNENDVLFIDVVANDLQGVPTTKTLASVGTALITGPAGVALGSPAVVIENGQIRITPGTAFDSLAAGETATINIPYTMTGAGGTYVATATVTVNGTNDAPYFSLVPDGLDSIGTVQQASFGGVAALRLTSEGASQSEIETFLGLASGTLDTVEGDTTDGAAVRLDLTLVQGETVAFSWNFTSTEYEPFNDYAFVSVAPASALKLSDIFTIGDSANDGFLHSSGWQQFTYTAVVGGAHRFGIGVMNEGDTAFDSFVYISGFSGIGFLRTTTEHGDVEVFDLLNGAHDPDTHDVLTVQNIVASGTDQSGNSVDVSSAITINGTNLSIDPTFFDALLGGEHAAVTVQYQVSDGHTTINNSVTLVIDGVNSAPVIDLSPIVTRVSVPDPLPDGTNPDAVHAIAPSVSNDGRYVVFFSTSQLPDNEDDEPRGDVFRYDRLTLTTTTLTDSAHIPIETRPPDEYYVGFSITGDGRFVVFEGEREIADEFGTHHIGQVYVYDSVSDQTSLLKNPVTHEPYSVDNLPRISGGLITFATQTHPDINGFSPLHILVTNLSGQILTDITTSSLGISAQNPWLGNVDISGNGRYLTFWSEPHTFSEFGPSEPSGPASLYYYDRLTNSATVIATTDTTVDDDTWWAPMSDDGRFVVFQSTLPLVASDNNGVADIYLWDRSTGGLEGITLPVGAIADGGSIRPSISSDGRYITFASAATNLVAGDTNGLPDTFIYDRQTQTFNRVSVAADGTQGNGDSSLASDISNNGQIVAFSGTSSNLVPGDNSNFADVFVVDRSAGTISNVGEDASVSAGNTLDTHGTFAFSDTDLFDTHTVQVTGVQITGTPEGFSVPNGGFGSFQVSVSETADDADPNGQVAWTFSVDNAAVQSLGAGQRVTQIYSVEIADPSGGTVSQNVRVTITGRNDGPVITGGGDTGSVTEDATATTVLGTLIDSDPDHGDTATWSIIAQEGQQQNGSTIVQGAYGALTIDQAGQWTYTLDNSLPATQVLDSDEHPVETFTIRVVDSQGAFGTHAVQVTVNGVDENVAPVAASDVFDNIPADWSLGPNGHFYKYVTGSLSWQAAAAAAVDAGGYLATIASSTENDFVFSLVGNDTAWLGGSDASQEGEWKWVSEPGSPSFTYTHWAPGEPNNNGSAIFSGEDYLATWGSHNWNDLDNSSGDLTLIDGYVIERETGANLQITEDAPFSLSASLLLENDTDPDGDALAIVPGVVSSGHSATVTIADGQVVYDATTSVFLQSLAPGEIATDTFSYTVSDGQGGTAIGQATVTVLGVNDAPTTRDASASGVENASVIAITLTGSDIDGTFGFKLSGLPAHGELSLTSDFSFVLANKDLALTHPAVNSALTLYFRPDADWDGETSFDFVAVDNNGAESENAAVATINVAAATDAVTFTVHTNNGFNLDTLYDTLFDADVTGISATQISLHNYGDPYSLTDDLFLEITTENLTWRMGQSGEAQLTGGTITGIEISRPMDGQLIEVASFEGFDFSATQLAAAISLWDQGDESGLDDIFGAYSYHATGGGGVDILTSGDADDEIDGGLGDDVIDGQGGADLLSGGGGSDTFVFWPGNGRDIITDITLGDPQQNPEADRIVLDGFGYLEDVSDLIVVDNGQGFIRIVLGEEQTIDLAGIAHGTVLNNHNFAFGSGLMA